MSFSLSFCVSVRVMQLTAIIVLHCIDCRQFYIDWKIKIQVNYTDTIHLEKISHDNDSRGRYETVHDKPFPIDFQAVQFFLLSSTAQVIALENQN